MCLAVPGKVIEIYEQAGIKSGKIDYGGSVNTVCLALVPDIKVGQYSVVHAGFALSIIDEEEAAQSLAAWAELREIADREGIEIISDRNTPKRRIP